MSVAMSAKSLSMNDEWGGITYSRPKAEKHSTYRVGGHIEINGGFQNFLYSILSSRSNSFITIHPRIQLFTRNWLAIRTFPL